MDNTIQTTTYNGWSNYETWLANLWLTNDEGNYRLLMEAVNDSFMQDWEKGVWLRDILSYQLYDEIDTSSVWQDLLSHAIGQINWTEIIESNREEE